MAARASRGASAKGTSGSKAVIDATSKLLADSYTLYLKTHNYHWNVTGPMFSTLHTMFETQYTELALAVDETRIVDLEVPLAILRWRDPATHGWRLEPGTWRFIVAATAEAEAVQQVTLAL